MSPDSLVLQEMLFIKILLLSSFVAQLFCMDAVSSLFPPKHLPSVSHVQLVLFAGELFLCLLWALLSLRIDLCSDFSNAEWIRMGTVTFRTFWVGFPFDLPRKPRQADAFVVSSLPFALRIWLSCARE